MSPMCYTLLRELVGRTAWDWKRCPARGSLLTIKHDLEILTHTK